MDHKLVKIKTPIVVFLRLAFIFLKMICIRNNFNSLDNQYYQRKNRMCKWRGKILLIIKALNMGLFLPVMVDLKVRSVYSLCKLSSL